MLGKFFSSGIMPFSASAVLIGYQQQAADDRQVLEQLNPLYLVRHVAVEDQRGGSDEEHLTMAGFPAAHHQSRSHRHHGDHSSHKRP